MILTSIPHRTLAEHAAAELASKGYWACPCPLCVEARKLSYYAERNGICKRCGKPNRGRSDAQYCRPACRIAAFRRRKKQASMNAKYSFSLVVDN